MGGLSAKELLHGATIPREGDFVEKYLENLAEESEDDDDKDDDDNDYLSYRPRKEGTDHRPKIPKMILPKPQARKTTPPSSAQNSTAPYSSMTTKRKTKR